MKRISLLYLSNFLESRATTRQYCQDLASRLGRAGVEVLRCSRFSARPLRLADLASAPVRLKARYDVALIEVFSGASFLWAEAAAAAVRLAKRRAVLLLHGGGLPEFAARHPKRVRRLLGSAAVVVAPSVYLASSLTEFRTDIRVIPNAIDISSYPFRHRRQPQPRIIWLRAFHEIYDPIVAIGAFSVLRENGWIYARMTMVGPDKGDGSLQRANLRVKELGLEQLVSFIPGVPKSDVPSVLDKADIFLNTSRVDNSPVSVLEAMACGLCVVSRAVGGVPYMVRDGETGVLARDHSAESLAEAMNAVLRASDLAARISKGGRELAEGADWSRVIARWVKLLNHVRYGEGLR